MRPSVLTSLAALLLLPNALRVCAATVRVRIQPADRTEAKKPRAASDPEVVLWLSPHTSREGLPALTPPPGHFRMEQRNKSFHPHLLVIPLGSTVEFPNLDPFFHNVFSQFNGKRFDLGLYESGSTKTVHFDHEGASYIFCNIHSQMAALVVTVTTPYSLVTSDSGTAEFHDVLPGDYILHVWREGIDPAELERAARPVHVSDVDTDVGLLHLPTPSSTQSHKNKFGEDYPLEPAATYP